MLHHKLMSVQAAAVGLQGHTERALCQPVGERPRCGTAVLMCVCGGGEPDAALSLGPRCSHGGYWKLSGKKPSFLNSFTIRTHLFWRQDTHGQERNETEVPSASAQTPAAAAAWLGRCSGHSSHAGLPRPSPRSFQFWGAKSLQSKQDRQLQKILEILRKNTS